MSVRSFIWGKSVSCLLLRWLMVVLLLMVTLVIGVTSGGPAAAAEAPVGLGTATSFAVLAGTTVTNTGPSIISGDLGVSPGTAITGFPPGSVINGTQHAADAVALQAQSDLTTAYNDAAGRGPASVVSSDLGGQTLVGGVYNAASAMGLTGTVTLDGQNDPDAVFIFQAGSTLITASGSTVALVNGAQACNVFWQVGSSATLGTNTTFVGTVMALTMLPVQTGTTVEGRVLARNGAVTLDNNVITQTDCATPPTTTTTGPSTTTTTGPSTTTTTSPPGSTTTTTGPPGSTTTTTGPSTTTTTTPPGSTTTTTGPSTTTTGPDDDNDNDNDNDNGQYDGGDDEDLPWVDDEEVTSSDPGTDDAGTADSLGSVNETQTSEVVADGKVGADVLVPTERVVPADPPAGVLATLDSLPVTGAGGTATLVVVACLFLSVGVIVRRSAVRRSGKNLD